MLIGAAGGSRLDAPPPERELYPEIYCTSQWQGDYATLFFFQPGDGVVAMGEPPGNALPRLEICSTQWKHIHITLKKNSRAGLKNEDTWIMTLNYLDHVLF